MHYTHFEKHRDTILNLSAIGPDERLLIERDGPLSVYYAPFEYVNPAARVVIVGITPGRTQMRNALAEAQRQLRRGADAATTVRLAKQTGAFSGALRNNLVNLLDCIGLHQWLGIAGTYSLFDAHAHLVQTASVLCFPVLVNGEDYRGTPNMLRHPMLKRHLLAHFGEQAKQLPNAVFIPLGDTATEAVEFLALQGVIDPRRILSGLPHPSGANSERIAYFLGNKDQKALSGKTNPAKLDHAKAELLSRMRLLLETTKAISAPIATEI